jgi:hypothetical protein
VRSTVAASQASTVLKAVLFVSNNTTTTPGWSRPSVCFFATQLLRVRSTVAASQASTVLKAVLFVSNNTTTTLGWSRPSVCFLALLLLLVPLQCSKQFFWYQTKPQQH